MQIDASFLLALGGIVTAVLAFISSWSVNKRAAHKDEVSLLREEVGRLQSRVDTLTSDNDNWRSKYDLLYGYVLMLRKILVDHDIDVPDMKLFDGDTKASPADATSRPAKIELVGATPFKVDE